MPQEITQEIRITAKADPSLDSAVSKLTEIESKLKSINRLKTVKVKATVTGDLNLDINKINAQAKQAEAKLRKTSGGILLPLGVKYEGPLAKGSLPNESDLSATLEAQKKKQNLTKATQDDTQATEKNTSAVKSNEQATTKASTAWATFKARMDSASKSSEDATWNFFRTRAILAALAAAMGTVGYGIVTWYNMASEYAEASHLLYATLSSSMSDLADESKTALIGIEDMFGNITNKALPATQAVYDSLEAVRALRDELGLDPTNVNRLYATFYEMANSADMAVDDIAKLSQGLTQLSYDLASLWDMPFQDVAGKLQSAIAGNSTAVKSLGIDISRTAADAWLLEHGIDATYISLDRASKMIVMYNMLMEHTTTAQNDLAKSAMQPANMFRILGEQATYAARQLGGALFPIFTQFLPLAIALANAIGQAAAALAAFLGTKLGASYETSVGMWDSYIDSTPGTVDTGGASSAARSASSSVSALGASMETLGSDTGGAEAAALSLKSVGDAATMATSEVDALGTHELGIDETNAVDSLSDVESGAGSALSALQEIADFQLGFDELHVMTPEIDTGGSGGGGGTGSGEGGGMSGIVAFDPYEMNTDVLEQILGEATRMIEEFGEKIDSIFGPGTWDQLQQTSQQVLDSIIENLGRVTTAAGAMMLSIIQAFDWPDLLEGLGDGFETVLTFLTDVAVGAMGVVTAFSQWEPVKKLLHDISYEIGFVVGAIGGLATAVLGGKVAFGLLNLVFTPFVGMVKIALSPFQLLLKAFATIGGLVVSAASAIGTTGTAIATAGGFAAWFVGVLTKVVSSLSGVLGNVVGFATKLVAPVTTALSVIAELLEFAVTGVGNLVTNLLSKLGVVPGVVNSVASGFRNVTLVLGGLTNPVALAIAIIAGLVAAFVLVYNESYNFRQAVSDAIDGIVERFNVVKEALAPFVQTFFDSLGKIQEAVTGSSGAIDSFGDAWNAIKDILVGILEPILTPLVTVIGKIVEVAIILAGVLGGVLLSAFSTIASAVAGAITFISGLVEAFAGLGEMLIGFFTGDLQRMGEGVEMLFSGLGELITGFFEIVTAPIQGVVDLINNAFGLEIPNVLDTFGGFLSDVFGVKTAEAAEMAEENFGRIEDSVSTHSQNAEEQAGFSFGNILDTVTDKTAKAKDNAVTSFEGMSTDATSIFGDMSSMTDEEFQSIFGSISDNSALASDNATASFDDLFSNTESIMGNLSSNVDTNWSSVESDVATHASQAQVAATNEWNTALTKTNELMGQIEAKVDSIWRKIQAIMTETSSKAQQDVSSAWDAVKTDTETKLSTTESDVDSAFKGIYDSISGWMDDAKKKVSDVWSNIQSTLSSIGRGISSAVSNATSQARAASANASAMAAQANARSSNVGWYATGGVFTGPSVIGVAEAGDEAVVPLSGARMRPFAEAVASQLNVSRASIGDTSKDDALVSAIAMAVYDAMINGFPTEITGDVYLDSDKVGSSLRKSDRRSGVGTSLIKGV